MSSTATGNRVFVINCGSSSLKYQLVDPVRGTAVASGLVEQIGEPLGRVTHTYAGNVSELIGEIGDHTRALDLVYQMFHESRLDLDDAGVAAVGHRIAHGGTVFEQHLVTDDVLEAISQLSELAPLHNPANVCGIEIAGEGLPDIPHVAVFDTEFFADLPPSATSIPIDAEVTHKYGIRRYGFHGTSHQYASAQAAQFLARDLAELNTIVLHIGNGAFRRGGARRTGSRRHHRNDDSRRADHGHASRRRRSRSDPASAAQREHGRGRTRGPAPTGVQDLRGCAAPTTSGDQPPQT